MRAHDATTNQVTATFSVDQAKPCAIREERRPVARIILQNVAKECFLVGTIMGNIEKRLEDLDIRLPEPLDPTKYGFKFVPVNRHGDLLYVSGNGDLSITGQVGGNLTVEQGYQAARGAALQCLAVMQKELGTLDKVKKIFKVLGFINSAPGFGQQPAVLNGCSDLLIDVFGEKGKHARSAIGTSALPMGLAVEVEMLVVVE